MIGVHPDAVQAVAAEQRKNAIGAKKDHPQVATNGVSSPPDRAEQREGAETQA